MQNNDTADSSDILRGSPSKIPHLEVVNSEAICSIKLPVGTILTRPSRELAEEVFEHGCIEYYNSNFLKTFVERGASESDKLAVAECFSLTFRELLTRFFEQECILQQATYEITRGDGSSTHFGVNMRRAATDDKLSSIWISFQDVTEAFQLKERLVTALEQQQTQLGRELHDSIGQLITSIRILAENLVNRLPSELETEAQISERIRAFSAEASEELSYLERGLLIPEELSEEGLSRALQKVADRTNSLPGISCEFVSDVHEMIGGAQSRLHLYRIVQEAVNNAVRHGKPDTLEIFLSSNQHTLELVISDNGTGFNPEVKENHGLGLNSMQYRADVIGATLDIDSGLNRGTTVRCILAHPQT